ncbi:MAG: aminotransferase class V-fold PLP-dependent enzyme [Saprospiraceae bacterium]|nr:aminotransferase class V-fold PLP-dependent enzyme [Saprospiraceae bacterium]
MTDNTLDPEDWETIRKTGHRMMDDVIDYLKDVRSRPVWQSFPDHSKTALQEKLPVSGMPLDVVYKTFQKHIFPYTKGNIHPRFWAWVQGTGTITGVMADMLASAMNPNVTIGEQSAVYVDAQVINWCKEMMGFPAEASGMLVSGASLANTTALIVARNQMLGSVRKNGLAGMDQKPVIYASTETHSCITKAVEVTGIGSENLRRIKVDEEYKIRTDLLIEAIESDISQGYLPYCVVANVGTVNTGSIDDLESIRDICTKYNLWFHIDGAFGALAKLVPEYQTQLRYIEDADSVAFDLHKWMYMPYEVACVLIKNKNSHQDSFYIQPSYLLNHERGLAAGPESLNNYGIELSRGFKALKVWMSIMENGMQKYADQIEKNILQARYLAKLITQNKELSLLAPVPLNIVCFRFEPEKISDPVILDRLNKEIVMSLQEQGIASPSSTILNGRYAIRVAITNHRSIREDFDILVQEVLSIGHQLKKSMS